MVVNKFKLIKKKEDDTIINDIHVTSELHFFDNTSENVENTLDNHDCKISNTVILDKIETIDIDIPTFNTNIDKNIDIATNIDANLQQKNQGQIENIDTNIDANLQLKNQEQIENIDTNIDANLQLKNQEQIQNTDIKDNIDHNIPKNMNDEPLENQFKKNKYIHELDTLFDTTTRIIENMNLQKKKQRELMHLNCLTKKAFIENIVEDNNQLCIKITEDIVHNSSELLKQIPKHILDSILSYDNQNSVIEDKPKKEFKLNSEDIFTPNNKIQIIGASRVLILRNIFKNIHKLYFDFFDFINDNLEQFKQSVIIDNPVLDNYKYILYDKSNVHSNSLYDIYKSWDNTPYEQYKISNSKYNNDKLLNLHYLKNDHISIIICVRNNFEYLKDSLGSVIAQTNQNWEVIIVNDGSSSCIYLDQIFRKDFNIIKPYLNRITIIENKEWHGIVYCQTQALEFAKCEYIGILDADDKLDTKCIEIVLDTYKKFKNNKNIFIFTNFYLTDENFNPVSLGFTKKPKKSLLQDGFALAFRTFKLRDYYHTTGYNPKFRYGGEDMDLLYKLEEVAQPFYINKPLYYYRRFDKIQKDCKNLSISKYHRYNCLMAKIVNSIERFGNCFKIRIYSKLAENNIENTIYNLYSKHKKGLMYKLIDFYVELYIGNKCEVCLGHIPVGNINDIMLRPYLQEYIKTKINEYKVYVKYSFQYNCITIIDKPIDFSIDDHLKININNLYDKVFISVNDNILNIDLDNIHADELPEYKKYILEKYYNEDNNLSFFHKLDVNYNSFHNIKNILSI
jgi:glycosyltransferase involved in cell wall biosynthesis